MNRVAAVGLTVVGVAVVLGVVSVSQQDDDAKREVSVVLSTATGVCKANEPVDLLGGSWVRSKLLWHITNTCATAQVVTMQDFRKRDPKDGPPDATTENDLVKPYPPTSASIPAGGSADVDTHIRKFKLFKRYKYSICAGTECIDPDVDVWPF